MNHYIPEVDCGKPKEPQIKEAGRMIDIDLEKPIDLSQMRVYQVSAETKEINGFYYVIRKSELFAYVINDDGDQEELTITFELKSQRMPKPK